ncbi:zinc finger protein OZF-like [Achroia grisella]|uniref:zinc finger protein OZF-like n=1 Tax=Achroia grisella TaxID=688607 RepID=UPI0027D2CD9D|nr:zinc finger protein OZF-like [Achroia grisella]
MDLLKLFLNDKTFKNTCFLCFKNNENYVSIYQDFNVYDECTNWNISLQNMIKYLLPLQDIIFHQACDICTHLIIKMYIILRKYNKKLEKYNLIIEKLISQVDKTSLLHLKETGKMYFNLEESENNSLEYINDHIVTEEEVDTTKELKTCEECNMSFKGVELFHEHKILTHRNTNKSLVCEICGKNYKTPQSLKDHLNSHTEKQCPNCNKVLKASYYKEHIRKHEIKERKKRKRLLYNCNDCHYKSVNKCSLNAHINKTHLHVRPFVCDICFKGFHKKSTLIEHVKIHEKRKDLRCEICGEGYVCMKTLTEHLRLHSGDRPYKCDMCNASFASSGRRTEHVQRKHMEKTKPCLICDKKFSLKKEVKRHMKVVHKNIDPTNSQLLDLSSPTPEITHIDTIM